MTMIGRVLARVARLAPPRHRELVRGMMAELDAIVDPAERARFALGAVAAIARLTVTDFGRAIVHTSSRSVDLGGPEYAATHGARSMSKLTTRQLLLRHAVPFAVSFASLTVLLLVQRWAPELSADEVGGGTMVEVLVLAMPSTLALTMPMAVFLAVSWVFTRLDAEGVLASAKRERGVRRLIAPVLGAAAVVSALALVSNTEVLPRANARLVEVLEGAPREPTARTMTMGELREAARRARAATGAEGVARATMYEVEIQKKLAVAVACVILALAAAAIAIRFPRGGGKLVLAASNLVFIGYYLLLIAGEVLADRQLLSPLVAMWMANVALLVVALVLVWPGYRPHSPPGVETLVVNG
jgi:lipopolysaccharide export LptBFGC system permease protein LptF